MPGYIMHLSEAKMIIAKLEAEKYVSKDWKQEFLLGALLPDACVWEDKRYTHFWAADTWDNRIVVPDLTAFLNKYEIHEAEAFMMGYWAHLHLDLHFFLDYWPRVLEFCDAQGRAAVTRIEATNVWLKRKKMFIRVQDFFSEQYCYGDYTKMNRWFCEKYALQVPEYLPLRGHIPQEAHYDRLPWLLEKLGQYLCQGEQEQTEETKVFDVRELDDFLREVAQLFIEEVKSRMEDKIGRSVWA